MKKKPITMKQLEDCLIQTIVAQAMLAEVKTRKKKPFLGSARFTFLIMGSNKREIFEGLTKWKTEAADFIEKNSPES